MNEMRCHLCDHPLYPEPVLRLAGMPRAAQYYPEKDEFGNDRGMDLHIYQCSSCALVQLDREPVSYYREVITAASISGEAKLSRFRQMKALVNDFGLQGKKALDVGCGKGEMLDILEDAGLKATGIEASPKSVAKGRSAGRDIIQGYIGDMDRIFASPFDAFISLNYLEHLPGPGSIIQRIHDQITADAVGFVTVPNLDYLLETKCFYEFVADHLSYFTKKTLPHAFESNGFDVLDCQTINNDNDIAVIVRKRKKLNISRGMGEMEHLIETLRGIISCYKARNRRVAVWGAGHRTLALLALCGLDTIDYVIDSAKFKQGKFTPVLHLEIVSPEHLKKEVVDLVIIMVPGIYPDEVLNILVQMNLGVDIAILRDNTIEFHENAN